MSRILVADDHDALRRGLALALRTAGHDVEEAPNGNAAIERLHNGYFDVVVSDLRMGGSDGLDVLRTTRTTSPDGLPARLDSRLWLTSTWRSSIATSSPDRCQAFAASRPA